MNDRSPCFNIVSQLAALLYLNFVNIFQLLLNFTGEREG